MDVQNIVKIKALGVQGYDFIVFVILERCVFLLFFVPANANPKCKKMPKRASHKRKRGTLGRGRRERRGVGGEKEEGVCRTVDCVFKNC